MTPKTGERLFSPAYGDTLLEIAEQDLQSAGYLIQAQAGRPENAVFLCQQAMEKALKAVLCRQKIPVPLIHDLAVLVAKMPDGIEPPYGYELARYNDYAGILRYERGHATLSADDLQAAYDVSKEVLEWSKTLPTQS